jgi:hypothetical protein
MTGAEQNLPVRPLAGAYIAANLPAETDGKPAEVVTDKPGEPKKPGTIEAIINSRF